MKKTVSKYLLFLFISVHLIGCVEESKSPVNKVIKSSNEVLNIPLKRRWKEYNEGNKVFNPSFEHGRVLNKNFQTFEINRWSKEGEYIDWVDTQDENFTKNDVSSGTRSVKIHNTNSDETGEDKAGVLSDYIKVINGNYNLSFDIKIKNVSPYNSRFGTRLMDAVNIRIFYYDKNKIRLNGKIYNPEKKKYIDHEFKALPFASFWEIDSLDWIRSNGITCKFPSPDRNMPKETKYVRIFFGLKGSGTMWVDNVSLRYTKQNFSVKEFLEPYKDSIFTKADLIIPTPKHVQPGEKFALFHSEDTSFRPLILIPENAEKLTTEAAHKLRQKIVKVAEEIDSDEQLNIPVTNNVSKTELKNASLVFSIGDTPLYRSYDNHAPADSIDGHEEGYVITKKESKTPVICLKGSTSKANYYAVQTANQLFDAENAVYHHTEIIDYPDFQKRAVVNKNTETPLNVNSELLNQYRFTHIYSTIKNSENFSQIPDYQQYFSKIKGEERMLKPGLALNPYKLFHHKSKPYEYALGPNPDNIVDLMKKAKSKGINDFIVRIDNTFSSKESSSEDFNFKSQENHVKYYNFLGAHKTMMNQMADKLSERTDIKFMPSWNNTQYIRNSQGKGEIYLKELFRKIPEKIDYLWIGATETPFVIDQAEIMHIESLINKYPVFYSKNINPYSIDNHIFAQNYPGKLRTTTIFKPFDLETPENFEDLNAGSSFIAEIEHQNSLDDIKIASYADYLWNEDEYDSNRSLLKVLISNYDKKGAFALLEFSDLYRGLQEMLLKMNKLDNDQKYIRSAKNFIDKMDDQMEKLEKLLNGTPILDDIQQMDKEIKQRFGEITG